MLPEIDGYIGMPDIYWYRAFHKCKSFGPTVENGIVNEMKPIKCHDEEGISEFWEKHWRWTIDGKNIEGWVDDLFEAKGTVEQGEFVYLKRSRK